MSLFARRRLPPQGISAEAFEWLKQELNQLQKGQVQIMAGIKDIQDAQAGEKADLAQLAVLFPQLLTAFASGAMTPAQAQSVLDGINSSDTSIKGHVAAIQTALGSVAPLA